MDGEHGRADPATPPGDAPGAMTHPGPVAAPAYGPTFGPRHTPRRSPAGWILGAAVLVLLIGGAAGVQLLATRGYDDARSRADAALAELVAADADIRADVDEATDAVAAADAIAADASGPLAGGDERAAFADASAALAETVDAADTLLATSGPVSPSTRPLWPWELFAAMPALDAITTAADARSAQLGDASALVDDATAALGDRALALFATVTGAAAAFESANVSAQSDAVLDFRDAARAVVAQERVAAGAADAVARYADAAVRLEASATAELAEKAGPLYDTRLAVEEYARSISGGVVLDFDWAPVVNGVGGYAGMAGTATWNTARGGFSTITLSDSVAVNWPSDDAMALVTHEVGHSITAKCSDLFDSGDRDANEEWATAWAISQGFTTPGNGTQAYGAPSQEMIDLAATCR